MKTIFFPLLAVLLLPLSAYTQEMSLEHVTQTVEAYFQNLSTYQADFVQITPGRADINTGTFYLERPRKFLWQYKTPSNQKLVSTGSYLFFFDPETLQTTQLPLNSGLAGFLTNQNFKLESNAFNLKQFNQQGKQLEVTLKPNKDETLVDLPLEELTLGFTLQPTKLTRLITADTLGNRTITTFTNIQKGRPLASSLFDFTPPLQDDGF